MSFLEPGKNRFKWIAAVVHTSVRPELGCVQCGRRLEAPGFGKFNLTGKCPSCTNWISDEDEVFDELED
jgi:hypothetical protein